MKRTDEADTVELPAAVGSTGSDPPQPLSACVHLDVAGLSHVGKVRHNNEDHFFIGRFGRFFETLQTNLPPGDTPCRSEEIGYGMILADGMGGHVAGELASKTAISFIINLILATPDWILRLDDDGFSQEVIRRAKERYDLIHTVLREQGEADPRLEGLGTTMTLAASLGKDVFIAYVGDSRAYLLRQKTLHQLTRDHTMAQALADGGAIAQQEVATHRFRHVLTSVLGGKGSAMKSEVEKLSLEDGDCLLLCTDGLTEMVKDENIADTLGQGQTAEPTCQCLIDQALEAGGRDNVTVIVARYRFPA